MPTFASIAAVAAGSAVGGVLRYFITILCAQRFGVGFPYGTLLVNVSGSFLIGFVVELSMTRTSGVTPYVRLLLATGVLGGYTTFSAFAHETFTLGAEGQRGISAAYALGSVVLGLAAYFAGMVVARLLTRPAHG